MLYPAYIHAGDKRHAHGVTIPDFPGCFAAADSWEQLPGAIQEAVEVYFEDEDMTPPPPTPLERLVHDPAYAEGVWMLVDIDLNRIRPKAVRINISLPESLVRRIDDYARARHLSRSGLLAQATERAITNPENR